MLAIGFGLWLWFGYGFGGGWLHAKLTLVLVLAAYHVWCGRLLAGIRQRRPDQTMSGFASSTRLPAVLVLVAICILTVVKPF